MKNTERTKQQRINDLTWDLVDEIIGENVEEDLESCLIYALLSIRNLSGFHEERRNERLEEREDGIELADLTPVFDGDLPEHVYERKLIVFIETLLAEERERVVEDIIRFVEGESGRSGRKEILGFLRGCLTSSKDKE